jgi:hypothetical protein
VNVYCCDCGALRVELQEAGEQGAGEAGRVGRAVRRRGAGAVRNCSSRLGQGRALQGRELDVRRAGKMQRAWAEQAGRPAVKWLLRAGRIGA